MQIDWLTQPNDTRMRTHPVRWVSMVDDAVGFGLGQPGDANAVLMTRDGGAIWQQVAVLPDDRPPWHNSWGWEAGSVSFLDAQVGWAVNASGGLLRTTDGGKQWQPLTLPPDRVVAVRVRFATPQKGCVQTDDQRMSVWWTKDGGATWEPALGSGGIVGCARRLAALFSANPDDDNTTLLEARPDGLIWATGRHGILSRISVTTDDGQHWRAYVWPGPAVLRSISFGSQKTGCAITNDGRLLFTHDGGATWKEAE